eukprot:s2095_g12.t1
MDKIQHSLPRCRHLCDLAEGGWIRSLVGKFADPAAGETDTVATTEAQTRTSSSCPLRPAQTTIVQRIEQRLAQLAKLPIETLERLVVVRYEPGQEFTVHHAAASLICAYLIAFGKPAGQTEVTPQTPHSRWKPEREAEEKDRKEERKKKKKKKKKKKNKKKKKKKKKEKEKEKEKEEEEG